MSKRLGKEKSLCITVSVVALCLLCIPASGCGRRGRHKLLTIIFTGVPPLEESAAVVEPPGETEIREAVAEQVEAEPITLYSHTPYADGQCDVCHDTRVNFSVPGMQGEGRKQRVFRKGGGKPGELVRPEKELCVGCHVQLSAAAASAEKWFLHTPMAGGECSACHDFHQSKSPYVLFAAPGETCAGCHAGDPGAAGGICGHAGACLDCHNPHIGRDRSLLTKDYREALQPVGVDKYEAGAGEKAASGE